MPASGRLLRRAAQRPADGLLRAGADRPRRPRARRRGPAGLRQRLALGLHAGADRRRGPLRRAARPAHGAAASPMPMPPRSSRRAPTSPSPRVDDLWRRAGVPVGIAGAARRGRRLPAVAAARPARGALGDQGAARRAAAAVRGRLGRARPRPSPEIQRAGRRAAADDGRRRGGRGLWPCRPDAARATRSRSCARICAARASSPAPRRCRRATARWLEAAGLVLVRQRPGSAKGVMFITIEDETGIANLVVWPKRVREAAPRRSSPPA